MLDLSFRCFESTGLLRLAGYPSGYYEKTQVSLSICRETAPSDIDSAALCTTTATTQQSAKPRAAPLFFLSCFALQQGTTSTSLKA